MTFLSDRFPVFWEEARGANVRDADGNVHLDLTSAFGVALAGHGHPKIVEAVRAQAGKLVHGMGDVHPPAIKVELLDRLAANAPWVNARVVLASTGSEAVEIALKTALLATGKPGIVAFEGGYHGLTFGALSAAGLDFFRKPFETRLFRGAAIAPWPDPMREGPAALDRALRGLEELLRKGVPTASKEGDGEDGDEWVPVGAVLLEPVQGRGGVRIPPPMFMEAVAHLAGEHGALVVVDEIFTGAGRCGGMLAGERLNVEPDIVCMGKALGGGMPLSACLAPRAVMDAWPGSEGEALHTSTFLGHPVACAAGLAMLDLLQEGLAEEAEELGSRLQGMIRDMLDGIKGVGDVRGLGAVIGIELLDEGGRPLEGGAVRVAHALLEKGVLVLPSGERGNVVQLAPSVGTTSEQVLFAVDQIHLAIRDVLRDPQWSGGQGP